MIVSPALFVLESTRAFSVLERFKQIILHMVVHFPVNSVAPAGSE